MKARLRVETSDGETTTVTAAVADFIRWERQYKRRTSDLAASWSLEDWAYLAWSSMRRTKATSATFDDWSQTLVSVELQETEEPTPTSPEASGGASSS